MKTNFRNLCVGKQQFALSDRTLHFIIPKSLVTIQLEIQSITVFTKFLRIQQGAASRILITTFTDKELESLLAAKQNIAKILPRLPEKTDRIRKLLEKKMEWKWTEKDFTEKK